MMKPSILEKTLREKFVNDLKSDNKIDSYQIKMDPIFKEVKEEALEDFNLHPSTIKLIDGLR